MTYFGPTLDPPLGGSGRKTTTLVRDHEYFIPTKFHQNPSSGFGEEVENVKSLRTDDGRCAMTIAHSSLRLGWAKKEQKFTKTDIFIFSKSVIRGFDHVTLTDINIWGTVLGIYRHFLSTKNPIFLTPCPKLIRVYEISICHVLHCPYIPTPISSSNFW